MFNLGIDQSFSRLAQSLFIYGALLTVLILVIMHFICKKLTRTVVYITIICVLLGYFITMALAGFVMLKYPKTEPPIETITIDDYVDASNPPESVSSDKSDVNYEDTSFRQMVEEAIRIKNNQ